MLPFPIYNTQCCTPKRELQLTLSCPFELSFLTSVLLAVLTQDFAPCPVSASFFLNPLPWRAQEEEGILRHPESHSWVWPPAVISGFQPVWGPHAWSAGLPDESLAVEAVSAASRKPALQSTVQSPPSCSLSSQDPPCLKPLLSSQGQCLQGPGSWSSSKALGD